ncbi:MAG: lactate utilization protein [Bacteroidales bacterium]|nr:lactate utilization protein [Bacteroidales bacterium]
MDESTTREKVLKRVRNALISKTANPYPDIDMGAAVYEPITEALDITFAEELTKVGGKFIYCENMDEMLSTLNLLVQTNNLQPLYCSNIELSRMLVQADVPVESDIKTVQDLRASITYCEFLVARLGSIMVSSRSGPGRIVNILPDVHIVIARTSQLVPEIKHAFTALKEKYPQRLPSMVSFITGPSRTADIEKTLVMGAHGPKELYVFLVDDINT